MFSDTNNLFQVVESDPAFSSSGNPFNLPREVMAIKCVLQRDFDALTKLTTTIDTDRSSPNFTLQGFRSPDDHRTVLHIALQSNDEEFIKAILSETAAKSEPDQSAEANLTLISEFAKPENGHEVGNQALMKKTIWNIDWKDADVAREIASYACHEGCRPSVLDMLMENYPKIHGGVTMTELLIERVYQALENGHTNTALHLVELSQRTKGSPCIFSDLQAQTLVDTMDREHPYNINIKPQEIRKKENINMRITAMHTAASNKNGGFLKRLLEMNPDARNNSDERSRRPIHYAAASYSSEPMLILMKRKDCEIDSTDKTGMTPLMIAAKLGRVNNCTAILEFAKKSKILPKSLVNRVDSTNYSSLHYAAEAGHHQIIETLQKWGGEMNKTLGVRSQRQTPLMLASRLGHYKAVESLIKCQAKIEMRDRLGRTALMHAALNGHYPTVAMLLNKGANANASDSSDNTALHYAAAYGWYHVVQLLLQGGASPDVVNQGESIII